MQAMAISSHLRNGTLPGSCEVFEVSQRARKSLQQRAWQPYLQPEFLGPSISAKTLKGLGQKRTAIRGERVQWGRHSLRRHMAPCAAVQTTVGSLVGTDFAFAVIVARFNDIVTRPLLAGALEAFSRHGVQDENIEVVWVPGSFEVPVVAQAMAKSGKFDAVLCIGAVIRGATTHYDAVAGAASSGILSAGLNSGVPCIMGVLTTENLEQAIDRAGGKLGNKGAEAAITAIEMASTLRLLKERGSAK